MRSHPLKLRVVWKSPAMTGLQYVSDQLYSSEWIGRALPRCVRAWPLPPEQQQVNKTSTIDLQSDENLQYHFCACSKVIHSIIKEYIFAIRKYLIVFRLMSNHLNYLCGKIHSKAAPI